ncbi:MAG: DNA polymerase III subunit gamma/tau [Candidatus Saccharibacteria bacterium]
MGQALYRKYRSKSLSEIVGQDHIIKTLQNSLRKNLISHAYLFTGPRGVGKTSIARILAHEINGLEYDEDKPVIDIIEIDAASNRRIDEIRDLRDKVHIAPTSAEYKVYIIDEVHMLTKEAFNALLKTLEEPPAHVIFILATTESHKLPETIISRTQRFKFKSIDPNKAVEHLRSIAINEKISISDEALVLIAEHGDGSFRDSIGLLDQVSSLGHKIQAEDIRSMLGIAPKALIEKLYKYTINGTPKDILDILTDSTERGDEPVQLAAQLGQAVRKQLLDGSNHALVLTQLMNQLIDVPASSDPETKLEVVLLGINLQINIIPSVEKFTDTNNKKHEIDLVKPKLVVAKVEKPKKELIDTNSEKLDTSDFTEDFLKAWSNVLEAIKKKYNTLYGIIRMAQPSFDEDIITLAFNFPFHQNRVNEMKNRQILLDLMSAQLGRDVKIICVLNSSRKTISAPEEAKKPITNPLDNISNIFGATEVLES